MPLSHYVIESLTFGFGALMAFHAWFEVPRLKMSESADGALAESDKANRGRWLSTLLWGFVFGVVLEWMLLARSEYSYGAFIVSFPVPFTERDVNFPLWVGVGWGVVVYVTTWTAQRVKLLPGFARAVFAGLLAVSIDLSLDPVAEAHGFWHWPASSYAQYHGVPFDNFICWFTTVTSYSFFVRYLFRKLDKRAYSVYWVPALGALSAILLVVGIDHLLPTVYEVKLPNRHVLEDAPVFTVLMAVACTIVGYHARNRPQPLQISLLALSVPVTYHLVSFALLASVLIGSASLQPLIVAIPMGLIVSVLAFTWGSFVVAVAARK